MIANPDTKAIDIVRECEKAQTKRANFDRQFEQIARYVLPRADNFQTQRLPGQRNNEFIFDSTAQLALPAFAAAIESLVMPRTQKYHGFKPGDPALLNDLPTLTWLESLRDFVFRVRYGRNSNFASQGSEVFMSLGAFGTGAMLVEDGMSKGIRYRQVPLSELWIEEDPWGTIDTFYWKYKLSVRQAMAKWPRGLPEQITKFAGTDQADKEFEFIFHVCPNTDRQAGGALGAKGMAFSAWDICVDTKTQIGEQGGYRKFPLAVSRYTVAPGEVYGRSPAWDALADIKTLNEMAKTSLRYGQLVTDPPWLTADVDSMSPFSMRAGAINPGYLNERGEELAKSAAPSGDPGFGLELMDQRRQAINRSFLITLFQILVETPEMTATEAMLRAQEKGALLAPTMGRQQTEFLATVVERELDILDNSGAIIAACGPPPPALAEHLGMGGLLDIEYDSPLTRAQRSEEVVGVLRTFEAVGTIAQYDPSVVEEFDYGRAIRVIAEGQGAPLKIMKTLEEKAAAAAAKQQQQDMALALQAAPVLADTAKTAAEAQKVSTEAAF